MKRLLALIISIILLSCGVSLAGDMGGPSSKNVVIDSGSNYDPTDVAISGGTISVTSISIPGVISFTAAGGAVFYTPIIGTTISASGSVGIGTSAPLASLQIIDTNKTMASSYGNLLIVTSDYGVDYGGSLVFGGEHFSDLSGWSNFAAISGRKENNTSGNNAGYLAFGTKANGGNVTEKMRITSAGETIIKGAFTTEGARYLTAVSTAVDYTPSGLTTNNVVCFTSTAAARGYTITAEDIASGAPTKPRTISVVDKSGGAGTNNITIGVASGTINGGTTAVISTNYGSKTVLCDGTNCTAH